MPKTFVEKYFPHPRLFFIFSDREEKLNKEIKILKDYLKTKIESLYSVEQLAERQATIIEKLKLKVTKLKQRDQPSSTQESCKENHLTTKEVML